MDGEVVRRRVVVRGRVQGVFFRDSVRRLALQLDVSGWALNQMDGSVEAVFEGRADAVGKMVEFCAEGPPSARVDEVDVSEESPEGLEGFEILWRR